MSAFTFYFGIHPVSWGIVFFGMVISIFEWIFVGKQIKRINYDPKKEEEKEEEKEEKKEEECMDLTAI